MGAVPAIVFKVVCAPAEPPQTSTAAFKETPNATVKLQIVVTSDPGSYLVCGFLCSDVGANSATDSVRTVKFSEWRGALDAASVIPRGGWGMNGHR